MSTYLSTFTWVFSTSDYVWHIRSPLVQVDLQCFICEDSILWQCTNGPDLLWSFRASSLCALVTFCHDNHFHHKWLVTDRIVLTGIVLLTWSYHNLHCLPWRIKATAGTLHGLPVCSPVIVRLDGSKTTSSSCLFCVSRRVSCVFISLWKRLHWGNPTPTWHEAHWSTSKSLVCLCRTTSLHA